MVLELWFEKSSFTAEDRKGRSRRRDQLAVPDVPKRPTVPIGELGHPRRPVSPPVGAIKLTLDVEEPPTPRDAPQLAFAMINELDARSRYQRRHGTRNEDLTGTGQGRHPRTDVNGHPGNVVAPGLDLDSVDPGAHIDAETLQGFSDGQAHSMARPGLSKVATKPSPTVFTSRPRKRSIWVRTLWS